MATDAVYAGELIEAIIAELKAHLPANWLAPSTGEVPVKPIQHGDLKDFPATEGSILADTPAIFARCVGIRPDGGGINGVENYIHSFHVVHLRQFNECRTDAGAVETNMTKARERYAKLLNNALFNDPFGRMGNPTLTCADTGASVSYVGSPTWDLGQGGDGDVAYIRDLRAQLWAIACDFEITVLVS